LAATKSLEYKIISFGDRHAPLTHKGWFEWLLKLIEEENPDCLVDVGDMFEGLAGKRWDRWPEEKWSAKDEISEVVRQAELIKSVSPNSRKVWLWGNHEDNLFSCNPGRISPDLKEMMSWRNQRGTEILEEWEEKSNYKHSYRFRIGPITFQHGCDISKDGVRSMFDSAVLYGHQNGLLVQGHSHKPIHPTECEIRSLPTRFWVANSGCGCDWDRMRYMDRFQKSKWGRGALIITCSRGDVTSGRTAVPKKNWDAELRIHSTARD